MTANIEIKNSIAKIREDHRDLANVLIKHRGIRRVVEETYPDRAHFLYELLQNSEDTKASWVRFELKNDCLIFEHNGRPFDAADIAGITDIGEGTKAEDEDQIGQFGIGFKAVFAYSETPSVYCPTCSFRIENLVLPQEIDPCPNIQDQTRFEFPFNNPKKEPDAAFEEIAMGLTALSDTSLLFLSCLESISWSIEGAQTGEVLRLEHSANHIEILHQMDGKAAHSSHFLRFDEFVEELPKQSVSVAFPLRFLAERKSFNPKKPIDQQMRIAPAEFGQVSVFFPAEKENSGLRFHLHAPFVPELSRASVKETPTNKPLFDQLARLSANSLHEIRDLGLLNAEALGVLPNNQDPIPTRYTPIREAVIRALNDEPLTPTQDKSHAPAKVLLQARAAIKQVISRADLKVLLDEEDESLNWAASAPQRNSNADRMMASLEVKEWDIDDLTNELGDALNYSWSSERQSQAAEWLSRKSAEWLQKLYSLLHRESTQNGGCYTEKRLPIIKLKDGGFAKGGDCFFPSDIGDDDEFPRVDAATYTSGKSKTEQAQAKKFLEEVGVSEVDEAELVKAILEQRYSRGSLSPRTSDLHRFMKLVEAEPGAASIFKDYYIFETHGGRWEKPGSVFLDSPFVETRLQSFFGTDHNNPPFALAERYSEERLSKKRFADFARAVGATTKLEVSEGSCKNNPEWNYLRSVGGERHTSPVDRDYYFHGFEKTMKNPNMELSRLIWQTLNDSSFRVHFLTATYQRNRSWGAHRASSRLVHQLTAAAWVPQKGGSFVKPADAKPERLPAGFPFDSGAAWLKKVGFGSEAEKRTEEARKRKAIAAELGFESDKALADAQWFVALKPEERRKFKEDVERRNNFEMPESKSKNPDRRGGKVKDRAAGDLMKESEKRMRSVQIGAPEVKQETRQYLRRQYTNHDDEMICQACQLPLPFKLEDGSFFFAAVELIPGAEKRHFQNYLALCPNHAAMYQYANGSTDVIEDLLLNVQGNELEVNLAGDETVIYFTETHLLDVKTLFQTK